MRVLAWWQVLTEVEVRKIVSREDCEGDGGGKVRMVWLTEVKMWAESWLGCACPEKCWIERFCAWWVCSASVELEKMRIRDEGGRAEERSEDAQVTSVLPFVGDRV